MNSDIIKRYSEFNHFGKFLGLELTVLAPGNIEYRLHIRKDHMATPVAAHGGVTAALMDSVLGVTALSSVFLENKIVSTVEYKINYFAPAMLHDQLLATARVEHKGKRLITVTGEIICVNRDNLCLAKGMGTFNAYPPDKAGY